jgi:hypothetical protein
VEQKASTIERGPIMRDLAWIKKSNDEAVAKAAEGKPIYDPVEKIMDEVTAVHERMERAAKQDTTSLWRYIVIDGEGNTQKNPLMNQAEVFEMFPEINPRWFGNFGVVELTIRQSNGTQLILKKVR